MIEGLVYRTRCNIMMDVNTSLPGNSNYFRAGRGMILFAWPDIFGFFSDSLATNFLFGVVASLFCDNSEGWSMKVFFAVEQFFGSQFDIFQSLFCGTLIRLFLEDQIP